MALSREQHNRIMRVYQDRRIAHAAERDARLSELELHVPAYAELTAQQAALRMEEARLRLKKDMKAAETLSAKIRELELEKKRILSEKGYPDDYTELGYTCPLCRDTGYVNHEKCGCHKKLISEIIYRKEAGIPEAFSRDTFETFDIGVFDDTEPIESLRRKIGRSVTQRAYMTTVEQICRAYAEDFPEKGGNLLLCGQTGTGKTFLSSCIAAEVIGQCCQVLYVRAGDFFDRLARESFERSQGEGGSQTDAAFTCDLLILDDLGTERRTDFTLSKLFSLINDRLLHDRATIISTNLDGNQLTSAYGERLTSRLANYTVIPFYGKDLRLK
ncbi:MAG: ATP-binding protein [Eubacteriales bacterium]|nr:ATP-binding protein [Eubacteriales bacterium]